ncbi:unnamed protein product [Rhizoctonia solani]|uniref:Uncharacterized protein n=1 Tax=Rhizoctonia solani TaxID=456999 RepID=A0A8H3DXJ8_9AGAM|nr:unnamed protein product [Rhizoctonia solani]
MGRPLSTPPPALFNRPTRSSPPESSHPPPQVKVCVLCTGSDLPVLRDAGLILESLPCVPNINPEHVITHTSQLIGDALDEFFGLTDIKEGALLILILSCHGTLCRDNNVLLQFKAQDGATVDSRLLQDKIMALPKHCTLEASTLTVVVDTCYAEHVIPGLYRVSTLDNSPTLCPMPVVAPEFIATLTPPSGSRLSSRISAFSASSSAHSSASSHVTGLELPSFYEQDRPKYKAQVIVWAASTGWSNSFTEENLPEAPGVYSIFIGAMFNQLSSNGSGMSRRSFWQDILTVVERHNNVRRERDLRKPPAVQANLKNRTQTASLLTSVDNPVRLLN